MSELDQQAFIARRIDAARAEGAPFMPFPQGPVAPWQRWPVAGVGVVGPLEYAPQLAVLTPEIQRMGVGAGVTFRRWGWPSGFYVEGQWGLGQTSGPLDKSYQFVDPGLSPERLHTVDTMRCLDATPDVAPGLAYELAHYGVGSYSVLVLERIPTMMQVWALDEAGDVVYQFANVNGQDPCLSELVHPDPAVGTLRWQFVLTREEKPQVVSSTSQAYRTAVVPNAMGSAELLAAWNDARYGSSGPWGDRLQVVVPSGSLVRLWAVLIGNPTRWRINVGGRLGGYWQHAGRLAAALRASTERTS